MKKAILCKKTSEKGATMVEAAFALVIVMVFVFAIFSVTMVAVSKVNWGNWLTSTFQRVTKIRNMTENGIHVAVGQGVFCDDETALLRQCELGEVSTCPSSAPSGCIWRMNVSVVDDGAGAPFYLLNATVRVPCAGCAIAFGKKNFEFNVKSTSVVR